jgi:hypothetical protein
MSVDNFRQLLALRYAAESVDEVNVFLARALEIQVRLSKQGALDRITGYLGGAAATVAVAFSLDPKLLVPAYVLAGYLALMALRAGFHLWSIRKQNLELTLEHSSVRDYLRKASRDREENRVTMAIQNRKAAARLMESEADLADDDKRHLQDNIQFWGERIKQRKETLDARAKGDIWTDDEPRLERLHKWIATEFAARPLNA